MQEFPFKLPESLKSYLELFPGNPEKTIEKLQAQLKKRGYDALGYFLISWFYLQINNRNKALENALIAKTYAPGSPFLDYVHYFLVHPKKFEAALPLISYRDGKKIRKSISQPNFLIDLENLIGRLSQIEGRKIMLKNDSEIEQDEDFSLSSIDIEDLATETLAEIHLKQGNTENAIAIYKRLAEKNPEKQAYFDSKIAKLSSN